MESGEGEVRSERDMEEAGRRARAWMNFCMGRTEITAIEVQLNICIRGSVPVPAAANAGTTFTTIQDTLLRACNTPLQW